MLAALFGGGFALLIASAFTGQGTNLVVGDAAEQFEYVRALMADGHLPRALIRFPCGVAAIGAIGFVPAYLVGALAGADGAWRSGWALPLQVAYVLPLLALSYAGLRANSATLDVLGYPRYLATWAVLFWVLTTNLAWYVFKEPAMSEAPTYATLSLYYLFILRAFFRADADPTAWVRLAAAAGFWLGLASMIRQQNILHALSLPLLMLTHARGSGGRGWRAYTAPLAAAAAVSAVLFAVPWLAWRAATGDWVGFSYSEGRFYWLSPRPWLVLFVPGYHGLFLFHPVFLIAVAGLVHFLRQRRPLAVAWVVAIAIQTYLVSTWYWLSFGASVGHRGFFTIFPLLLPGFAAAYEFTEQRGWRAAWIGAMAVLIAGNVAVMLMTALRLLDPSGGGLPPDTGFPR